MALTNLMVRISSSSDFSWSTKFGYLGQLAQWEPPGQVYFARSMGFNSPPGTNLGHKFYIYRFFFNVAEKLWTVSSKLQNQTTRLAQSNRLQEICHRNSQTFFANYKSIERNSEFCKRALLHLEEDYLLQPS